MQGDELNNAKGVIKLCKGMKLNNVKGVIKLCKGQKSIIRWGPNTVTFQGINCLNKKKISSSAKEQRSLVGVSRESWWVCPA